MRILLLGKNGQVGWELQRALAPLGDIIALGRKELDIADMGKARSVIRQIRPDIIVNAAAYTAVEKAEEEKELSMIVNGVAPGIIAEEAKFINALLIHYSTDYVFDGSKSSPYNENDHPNPVNNYGFTKLAGEKAILDTGANCIILRTSWVYALRGSNFLLTIIKKSKENKVIKVVDDQIGSPTWARLIAESTALILAKTDLKDRQQTIYHLSSNGKTSWYGFAEAIIAFSDVPKELSPVINAIKTSEFPTKVKRPMNSLMDNSFLKTSLGIAMPDWKDSLKLAMNNIANE